MGDQYWLYCPYAESDECPQSDAIVRVYLFPQLLNPTDIDSITQTCRTCGKYLDQKRKYPRIKRPLQIVLIKGGQTVIKGNTVDLSEGGVLIQHQKWADFVKDEKVHLEIYPPNPASDKSSPESTKVSGLIKRVEAERQQLAIVFLSGVE